MTIWLAIILGAVTVAETWFLAPSADYTGLLGCFPPPDPSEAEPTCAQERTSPRGSTSPDDDRLQVVRVEEEPGVFLIRSN
jgi:hypothetical protein